jgi:hypothetical protein
MTRIMHSGIIDHTRSTQRGKMTFITFVTFLSHFVPLPGDLFLNYQIKVMKTLEAIHHRHKELSNEIFFLKKEIDFLLKILRNCYSSSVQSDKIKLMDGYWKSFDHNKEKLDHLLNRIELEEKKNASLYKNTPDDILISDQKESEFNRIIETVQVEVKLIKESFYEFMQGCNACVLKTH